MDLLLYFPYLLLALAFGAQWIFWDKISPGSMDNIKFLEHTCLVVYEIYAVGYILSLLCGLLFYFGFVITIIVMACVLLIGMEKDNILKTMEENPNGAILLNGVDFFKSTAIYLFPYLKELIVHLFLLVVPICLYVFQKLMDLNTNLADNTKTKLIKKQVVSSAYALFMPMVMGMMFGPSTSSEDNSTAKKKFPMGMPPFATPNFTPKNTNPPLMPLNKVEIPSSNMYKNIPSSNSDPMSFLKNTNFVEDDIIDDDLDEDLDACLDDCLEELEKKPSKPAITQSTQSDSSSQNQLLEKTNNDAIRTADENKQALKKKIEQKKMARSGKRQQTTGSGPQVVTTTKGKKANRNNAQTANQPSQTELSNMMDFIMQKDNMEMLMKEFPPDQNGQPTVDPIKLRKLMGQMAKK
jgi:hypothetical protein